MREETGDKTNKTIIIIISDIKSVCHIKNADCPIDSIILESLGSSGLKWSKLGTDDANSVDEYKEVQNLISEQNPGKCKLYYDFAEWNK